MNEFSRSQPSPRYRELVEMYRDMHTHGAVNENIPADQTFDGRSLRPHANSIRGIIEVLGSKTILDYGSGKGRQYQPMKIDTPDGRVFPDIKAFWNVDKITCYDPGHAPFNTLPDGRFDGVVSTDVLEHCPAEDIPWIIDEIFSYAEEFAYLNVACYPAGKTLPNGENAHCTLEPPEWWQAIFDKAVADHPGLRYYALFDIPEVDPLKEKTLRHEMRTGKSKPK
ncbi:MAG: class I SAM-dependent methyltransferase [Rhodospirillales bacterium]|nr:class I SAM-dependent methyltransferase [Rhodospirillales bacterium]